MSEHDAFITQLPSHSIQAIIVSSTSGLPLFSLHSPYTQKIDTMLFSGLLTAIQDHLNEYSDSTQVTDDISMITRGEFIFITINDDLFRLTAILDSQNPIADFTPLYTLSATFKVMYEEIIKNDNPLAYQPETFSDFKYVCLLIMSYPNLNETSIPSKISSPIMPRISLNKNELSYLEFFDGQLSFKDISNITEIKFHELLFIFSKLWYAGLAVVNYDPFVYDIYVITQKGIDALLYGSLNPKKLRMLSYFNGHMSITQIQKITQSNKKQIESMITGLVNDEYIRPLPNQYAFIEGINFFLAYLHSFIYENYPPDVFLKQLQQILNDNLSLILKLSADKKWVGVSSSYRTLVEELYDSPANTLKYLTPLFLLIFSFISQQSSIKNATHVFNNALKELDANFSNSYRLFSIRSYFQRNQFI